MEAVAGSSKEAAAPSPDTREGKAYFSKICTSVASFVHAPQRRHARKAPDACEASKNQHVSYFMLPDPTFQAKFGWPDRSHQRDNVFQCVSEYRDAWQRETQINKYSRGNCGAWRAAVLENTKEGIKRSFTPHLNSR